MINFLNQWSLVEGLNESALIFNGVDDVVDCALLVVCLLCFIISFAIQELLYPFQNQIEMLFKVILFC